MTTSAELPPGSYTIDSGSSRIGFEANLLLGLKAKGRFDRFESMIDVRDSLAGSSISLTVWTDSVRTGIKKRDEHLRAENVFAVREFPTMEFRSTRILEAAPGYDVEGVLRVRDVSREVAFHATATGHSAAARYTAEFTVTPGEFGISRHGTTKPLTVILDVTLKSQRPVTGSRA